MIKRVACVVLVFALTFLFIWASGWFVTQEPNPAKWSENGRLFMIWQSTAMAAATVWWTR